MTTRTGLFERLVGLRNDLGLLAEEYDARAGRQVGNFPQAFSHVSLVNAAYNLSGHLDVEELATMAPSTPHLGHPNLRQWRYGRGGSQKMPGDAPDRGRPSAGSGPRRTRRRTRPRKTRPRKNRPDTKDPTAKDPTRKGKAPT